MSRLHLVSFLLLSGLARLVGAEPTNAAEAAAREAAAQKAAEAARIDALYQTKKATLSPKR